MIAAEVKCRETKKYMGNCRHLHISKQGHAVVRKTGRPDRDIWEEL